MIISHLIFLKMRNISDKSLEKVKTQIFCSIIFPENRAIYEIMWKSMVDPDIATARHAIGMPHK